jgi:DNA-binding NarL/FixJ family response regulator
MQFLIVEDHYVVAEAVANALNAMPKVSAVDHVATVDGALAHLNANPGYSMIVLDLQLDGASGFDALDILRDRFPHIPVMVFSADHSRDTIERVYEQGARGYLSKQSRMAELIAAIEIVLRGENFVSQKAAECLGPHIAHSDLGPETIRRLSTRQGQILRRLLRGEPNKVIARELDIAVGTVKAHANSIYTMFTVHNRAELVARAGVLGLYSLLASKPPAATPPKDNAGDDDPLADAAIA